ncbi:hypothetical protein H9Y04_40710 [Streptomyces sp. TRM66268-LWL]|uniref:Uncharacterized protein n=1 Tax=Streptomyces polyasparticus TaxID=2767826 RepID=A0ABR7SVS1_9ACTN|nr:hypothetical protein [Streptomyces polyasparticus]MBC9718869.1 hypothetical protein [Streptomyces polyasparticus]
MPLRTLAACAAAATTAILLPLLASAPATASTSMLPGSWSTAHGAATATGTTSLQRPGPLTPIVTLVIKGKLTSTGPDCYAAWTQITTGTTATAPVKTAEVCGSETVDIATDRTALNSVSGHIFICRGTENATDCGPRQRL